MFFNERSSQITRKITLDVIDQLSKQTGKPPKQVTYFGDGAWDYQTCAKLEIDFFGIDVAGDGRLRELGAKNVFRDFKDPNRIFQLLKSSSKV